MICRTLIAFTLIVFSHAFRAGKSDEMRVDDVQPFDTRKISKSGCKCQSDIKTGPSDWFQCDWCKVSVLCKDKKVDAKSVKRGPYAYAYYPEITSYERQSYSTKMNLLWSKVYGSRGRSQPLPGGGPLAGVERAIKLSMRVPFENHRDTMAPGRKKVIHTQGAVCKSELTITQGSYTGGLSKGTHPGLIRMGSAFDAPKNFPGLGLKWLRSGVRSGNIVMLRKVGDAPAGAFFGSNAELSNHVVPPGPLQKIQKFQQASDCISMVGLSNICKYDKNGRRASNVKFPYELLFQPHSNTSAYSKDGNNVMSGLGRIPRGITLYNVYAKSSPTSGKSFIGYVRTTSACVASTWGDENLHFEHQRMEEDFALRRDWIGQVKEEGCKANAKPSSTWQCL